MRRVITEMAAQRLLGDEDRSARVTAAQFLGARVRVDALTREQGEPLAAIVFAFECRFLQLFETCEGRRHKARSGLPPGCEQHWIAGREERSAGTPL